MCLSIIAGLWVNRSPPVSSILSARPQLVNAAAFAMGGRRGFHFLYRVGDRRGSAGGATTIKPFAQKFYNSPAWKNTREVYSKSVGGLCERCLSKGLYNPGEIVHHKIHLTPENINDPRVTLDPANLENLCRECHAAEHERRKRRFKVDELGRVTAR